MLEIGYFWARLGRGRCLLLSNGTIEIPSDLSGVDCLRYTRSPREQFESVREFIAKLESLESGVPVESFERVVGRDRARRTEGCVDPRRDDVERYHLLRQLRQRQ